MPSARPPVFDAVLFDIDNVLIDTRRSYLDAIRWAIELYLTVDSVPFFPPLPPNSEPTLLSAQDVNHFKLLGGFNDDWDCCYGLLIYLTQIPVKQRTITHLKKVMDIEGLSRQAKKRPLRVSGIIEMFGRSPAVKIERVARIFQEVYLGRDLFKLTHRRESVYWRKRGLMHREKLIFRKSTLVNLKKQGVHLGIATGRPRFEAMYALKHFGILDFFDSITTLDEVKKAEAVLKQSLRKPHPFSLIEAAKKMGVHKNFMYVGDLPDDILAAKHAQSTLKISSVAFPWFAANSKAALKEIENMKPDFILKKAVDLPKLAMKGEL